MLAWQVAHWRGKTVLIGLCVGSLWLSGPANAQANRPELFGLAGVTRVSGDEGSLGTGVAVGGAFSLPFARHWAVDIGVSHMRSERPVSGLTLLGRHTHISPALQYRRGSERLYGFAAFGAGASVTDEGSDFSGTRRSETGGGLHLHGAAGFVKTLSDRILLRAEFFSVFRYVSPDLGVRAGIGYRF